MVARLRGLVCVPLEVVTPRGFAGLCGACARAGRLVSGPGLHGGRRGRVLRASVRVGAERGRWAGLQEKDGVAGPAWKRSGPAKERVRRPGWAASWILGWLGFSVFSFSFLFLTQIKPKEFK